MNQCAQLFIERLPKKPYCTNELGSLYIRDKNGALGHSYLQFNGPDMVSTLVFDIDRAGAALAWEDAGLPPPHWISVNPKNNHAHLGYQLAIPVCRTSAARLLPLRYLAAIEHCMTVRLKADTGYAGLLTKNPLHSDWLTIWHSHEPYTLGYLADFCPKGQEFWSRDAASLKEPSGLRRNVTLFDATRRWAYRAIRQYWGPNGLDQWERAVIARLESLNCGFELSERGPLPPNEIRSIARSIARWTWMRVTPSGFSESQARRGSKGGKVSKGGRVSKRPTKSGRKAAELLPEVLRLKALGYTNRDIAEDLGIGAASVGRYLKQAQG